MEYTFPGDTLLTGQNAIVLFQPPLIAPPWTPIFVVARNRGSISVQLSRHSLHAYYVLSQTERAQPCT